MISLLKLSEIKRTTEMQPRATIQMSVAEDYAEDIKAGARFPPLVVFRVGEEYILVDGFHRALALQSAGMKKAQCEVLEGTMRDAFLYASGVNAGHGLRRTNEDKRRAVERLLHDPEWSQWSDNKIADICKVNTHTVAKYRENYVNLHSEESTETPKTRMYATKHGTVSHMKTGNIGKKPGADIDALIAAIEDPAVRQKTIEYRAGCIDRGEQVYANDIREFIKMQSPVAPPSPEPVVRGEEMVRAGKNHTSPFSTAAEVLHAKKTGIAGEMFPDPVVDANKMVPAADPREERIQAAERLLSCYSERFQLHARERIRQEKTWKNGAADFFYFAGEMYIEHAGKGGVKK